MSLALPGPDETDEIVDFAIDIAREAGRIMMDGLGRTRRVAKKSQRELVTEIDEACERHVIASIRASYPDHDYFAEEGSLREDRKSPWRWIVDPLDGTTNYAHGIPAFSISLGLEKAGELRAGVVYAPYLNEMFFASRGKGAYLNTRAIPIRVSETDAIPEAVLATGFAYVMNQTENTNLDNFARLTREARGTRRLGSAAIDLCYVACGRYDGYWEMHLKPYDVAAGAVILREAGGKVTDFKGGEDWLEGQNVVATNGKIHEALRSRLDPLRPDGHVHV